MEANEVIRIHTDEGVRTALVTAVGPKFTRLIWIDDRKPGVRVNKVRNNEVRATTLDYPLAKAKRGFRKAGAHLGITKTARKELRA